MSNAQKISKGEQSMSEKISLLEKLEKQKAQLTARIQSIKAREKVSERKEEIRLKMLIGSYYIEEARKSGDLDKLKLTISKKLKRESDRALFELRDVPKNENE
jgi:hypothetical protein